MADSESIVDPTVWRPKQPPPLAELNHASAPAARASAHIDLAREDRVDDAVFNRILWRAFKGTTPYPTRKRLALLEAARAR